MTDVLVLIGVTLLTAGAGMIYGPLALLLLGSLFIWVATTRAGAPK